MAPRRGAGHSYGDYLPKWNFNFLCFFAVQKAVVSTAWMHDARTPSNHTISFQSQVDFCDVPLLEHVNKRIALRTSSDAHQPADMKRRTMAMDRVPVLSSQWVDYEEGDLTWLMDNGNRRVSGKTDRTDNATSSRSRQPPLRRTGSTPTRSSATESRRLLPPPPRVPTTTASSSTPLVPVGVELLRQLLEMDQDLPTNTHEGCGVMPAYMRDNAQATFADMSVPRLARMLMSVHAFLSILGIELASLIQDELEARERIEGDVSSLMQLGQTPGGQGGQDDGDDERPPWRPRKRCRDGRRRLLIRRRRNLNEDLAELDMQHSKGCARHTQTKIARELRNALSQRAQPDERIGLSRNESDRVQDLLHRSGDRGAVITIAAMLEMVAVLLLDFSTVCNIHILTNPTRMQAPRTMRRRLAAAVQAHQTRRRATPPRRRRHSDGVTDEATLMQAGPASKKPVANGVQTGHMPDKAVEAVVEMVEEEVLQVEEDLQPLLRHALRTRAQRNLRSKIPALREVSGRVVGKLGHSQKQLLKVKSVTKQVWQKVRSQVLKWARKKAATRRGAVELLQRDLVVHDVVVHDGVWRDAFPDDHVSLMQASAHETVVDVEDSVTEPCAERNPSDGLVGDEGLWFSRLQLELQRLKKSVAIGAHVLQLKYHLSVYRTGNLVSWDRADALEALLAAYQDEPTEEGSCVADTWGERWARWTRAFLGVDDRDRLEGPWCPDPVVVRANEASMFEEIAAEYKNERAATRAQRLDDMAMAEALAAQEPGSSNDPRPRAQQVEGESERVVDRVELPRKRGPGGVVFEAPEVIPRSVSAMQTPRRAKFDASCCGAPLHAHSRHTDRCLTTWIQPLAVMQT